MKYVNGVLVGLACVMWACDDGGEGGTADPTPDAAIGNGGAGGQGGAGGDPGAGGEGGGVEATLQSLSIEPAELEAGGTHQFVLTGTYDDGSTRDLSAQAEWAADNADIVAFGDGGQADLPYGGAVKVTATLGEMSAEWETTVTCDYPRFPANIRPGQAVAAVKWESAYREGNEAVEFDFRQAHCYAEFKDVEAFILIVNAAWCQPCIQEISRVGPRADDLREAGGMLMYIVLQDVNYGPMNADGANRHINRLVGADSPGLRMGAVGSNPEQFFNNPAIIEAFPTSFVVRKRDMQVIADSRTLQYHLDPYFGAILADLDADWTDPATTAPLPFDNNCAEGDEEAGEPNDAAAQATVIEPGEHSGGICTREPDFYRIQAEGGWRFEINFSHAVGDIDIGLWDENTDDIARRAGQPVLSQGSGNQEVLEGSGPAVLIVYGYNAASAPYTINLTAQ